MRAILVLCLTIIWQILFCISLSAAEKKYFCSYTKEDNKASQHTLLEVSDLPTYLYHATNADFMFEVSSSSGAPKGPAFFSLKPTKSRYIDLYHRHTPSKIRSREIRYIFKKKPSRIALLRSLDAEKKWVESILGESLPVVLSGRGSILDRFQGHKKKIQKCYKSQGYEGLYDPKQGVFILFEPEKYIKVYDVDLLSPPMNVMIRNEKHQVFNYHVYLAYLLLKKNSRDNKKKLSLRSSPLFSSIARHIFFCGMRLHEIKQDVLEFDIFENPPEWALDFIIHLEGETELEIFT